MRSFAFSLAIERIAEQSVHCIKDKSSDEKREGELFLEDLPPCSPGPTWSGGCGEVVCYYRRLDWTDRHGPT